MTFNAGNEPMDIEASVELAGSPSVGMRHGALSVVATHPLAILARLGSVVCIHRQQAEWIVQHDVLELLCGTRAVLRCEVDAQGPVEVLCFVDNEGQCRLQVGLLPETDFLAWEVLQDLWRAGVLQWPERRGAVSAQPLPWRVTRWFATRTWTASVGRFVLDPLGRLALLPLPVLSVCSRQVVSAWSERAKQGGLPMRQHCRCPQSRFAEESLPVPVQSIKA